MIASSLPPAAVAAIDPGPERSALVVWDGEEVRHHAYLDNVELLRWMTEVEADWMLAIEMIAHMGMAVGAEVFETCRWVGRFQQAWGGIDEQHLTALVYRRDAKLHLCGSSRAKDPNVRQALIDLHGGKGKKCPECKGKGKAGPQRLVKDRPTCPACSGSGWDVEPGKLAELADHKWAAMAIAETWWVTRRPLWKPGS